MEYILLGAALIVTLGVVFYMFFALTPNVMPDNLIGFFFGILWMAVGVVVAIYSILFLIQFFLG